MSGLVGLAGARSHSTNHSVGVVADSSVFAGGFALGLPVGAMLVIAARILVGQRQCVMGVCDAEGAIGLWSGEWVSTRL